MLLQFGKASVMKFDERGTSKSIGFLDFSDVTPILVVMLIVLNILASARRSGCLAADVFSAS
jgi:hypothetical protein